MTQLVLSQRRVVVADCIKLCMKQRRTKQRFPFAIRISDLSLVDFRDLSTYLCGNFNEREKLRSVHIIIGTNFENDFELMSEIETNFFAFAFVNLSL